MAVTVAPLRPVASPYPDADPLLEPCLTEPCLTELGPATVPVSATLAAN